MLKKGIALRLNSNISTICDNGESLDITLDNGEMITAGLVLYATGRVPNIQGLGLENTRVKLSANNAIIVDDHYCTDEPSIYAIGDVIDRVQLTPVAIKEAMVLTDHLYSEGNTRLDYDNIATAVFSQPELACVGLTEEQAKQRYEDIGVYRSEFKPMFESLGQGSERVFIKMIVDNKTDTVLGCHMVGHHAAEIIQGIAIALKAGAKKSHFDATIGIHPSTAEEFVTLK